MSASENRRRYELLDVVRAVASLCVVFWHWQHFYFVPNIGIVGHGVQGLPLFWLFWPIYLKGYLAVDLFFCLSGFVFYCIYSEMIKAGRMTGAHFAFLRFSRLYPLHFATLLAVALLQPIYLSQHGVDFVYPINDLRQFVLHLLFVSNWPMVNHYLSFNGPIWSVSIEVMLYIAFFIMCRLKLTSPAFISVLAILGLFGVFKASEAGRGLHSFFIGGLCFYVFQRFRSENNYSWKYLTGCILAVTLASVATTLVPGAPRLFDVLIIGGAFPSLVLILALADQRIERFSRPIAWLGSISYSSYLLHFPLQLVVVVAAFSLGKTIDYSSPLTLVTFMGALIILSLGSYYGFEDPSKFICVAAGRSGITEGGCAMVAGLRQLDARSLE